MSEATVSPPLLAIDGLRIDIRRRDASTPVVTDVSLTVAAGETVGLVGESGCGKSLTSLSILGVLPQVAKVTAGSIRLDGRELVGLHRRELEQIRGRDVAMIFQDATRSLNPAYSVGDQIAEVARKHLGLSRRDGLDRAVEMLERVGIRHADKRIHDFPHMFSGGMAQRVMIAMALVCGPKLLIADEPTTALDVTVQAQVLRLLRRLQEEMGLGVLFITHDLGVVAEMCDRVAVMYAGQIVEQADVWTLFSAPRHPYTEGLLHAIPRAQQRAESFGSIPGTVPSARAWPSGCRFHPRCAYAIDGQCDVGQPGLVDVSPSHESRCVRTNELKLSGVRHEQAV